MGAKYNRTPIDVFGWKGDAGEPGADGLSITSGTVNASGHLILTLSDNSTVDVGTVVGPQGNPGANGDNGSAATISIGTITTGAAGSSASVTNSGTSSAAVFDFTIPAGADGQDGAGSGDMLAATYNPIIAAITGESTYNATPDSTLAALWALPWTEGLLLVNPAAGFVSPYKPLARNGRLMNVLLQTGPGDTPASATTINFFINANNIFTGALTSSATTGTLIGSITLSNACYLLIDKEVIQVTAIGGTTLAGSPISGTELTFTRAQGWTTAAAHSASAPLLIFAAGGSLSSATGLTITSFRDSGVINGGIDDYMAFHVAGSGLSACSVTCQATWVNR